MGKQEVTNSELEATSHGQDTIGSVQRPAPKAIGSPIGAFRLAMEELKSCGAKKVIDCPAGEGAFTRMLVDEGFDAHAADIYPDQFVVPEIECQLGDLNGTLPYDDESFDAVVCLNGLERVWARGQALKEFNRITKTGGTIVISYPNQGDLRRRMLNFVTGSVTWNVIGPPHTCNPEADPPASSFRYAMTTANVLSGLKSVHFEATSIRATHYASSSILMSPLVAVPKLASLLASRRLSKAYFLRETSTLDALLGAFLVVTAKKTRSWVPGEFDYLQHTNR